MTSLDYCHYPRTDKAEAEISATSLLASNLNICHRMTKAVEPSIKQKSDIKQPT